MSRGKFDRLVDEFVGERVAGGPAGRPARRVAAELQARIDAIAQQLGISKQTVLRSHLPDNWGREMAASMIGDAPERSAVPRQRLPQRMPVAVAGRLVAALGQVMIYSTANQDQAQDFPVLDATRAAEAISGLGLAISESAAGTDQVTVGVDVVEWTRATLETLRDQLRSRTWTFCPCGERHGQAQVDQGVLRAVEADLLLLPVTTLAQPVPA